MLRRISHAMRALAVLVRGANVRVETMLPSVHEIMFECCCFSGARSRIRMETFLRYLLLR